LLEQFDFVQLVTRHDSLIVMHNPSILFSHVIIGLVELDVCNA